MALKQSLTRLNILSKNYTVPSLLSRTFKTSSLLLSSPSSTTSTTNNTTKKDYHHMKEEYVPFALADIKGIILFI